MPDVASQHNQAQCQWCRKDQANWTPDPAPEDRGHDDRGGRQAGAATIEEGLQDLPGYALCYKK